MKVHFETITTENDVVSRRSAVKDKSETEDDLLYVATICRPNVQHHCWLNGDVKTAWYRMR